MLECGWWKITYQWVLLQGVWLTSTPVKTTNSVHESGFKSTSAAKSLARAADYSSVALSSVGTHNTESGHLSGDDGNLHTSVNWEVIRGIGVSRLPVVDVDRPPSVTQEVIEHSGADQAISQPPVDHEIIKSSNPDECASVSQEVVKVIESIIVDIDHPPSLTQEVIEHSGADQAISQPPVDHEAIKSSDPGECASVSQEVIKLIESIIADIDCPPSVTQEVTEHSGADQDISQPPVDHEATKSSDPGECASVSQEVIEVIEGSGESQLPIISVSNAVSALILNSEFFCLEPLAMNAVNYFSSVASSDSFGSSLICCSSIDGNYVSTSAVGVAQAHDTLLDTPQTQVESPGKENVSKVHVEKSNFAKKQSESSASNSCSKVLTRSASKQCGQGVPLPTTKRKNSRHKKPKVTNIPVVSPLDIPSGSDDSALSESDVDDECSVLNRKSKPHVDSRRILPSEVQQAQTKKKRYTWVDGSLLTDEESVKFSGTSTLPEDILELKSPLQFFRYFFSHEVNTYIAEQTNIYSAQCRPEKPLNISTKEVETFLGVCMYMSLVKMSCCKHYWSKQFRIEQVARAITSKAFLTMKRYLHFCDNSSSNDDRLKKIRPLINMLKCRFLQVPLEENLSVDEQMVPFKGRSTLKQYLPKKPHKWGYKIFVLSGNSGFAYDMEVYTGKQDNVLLEGEKDCGASGNVVIRLTRAVPSNVGHKLYFDNYFCSPELQISLAQRGIHCLGTVRSNRLPNCTIMSDTELKRKGRGAHVEKITRMDEVTLSVVRWFDNRLVTFLSTFVGAQPVGEISRFSRVTHADQQVACPHVVRVYNAHMGGVDLLDSLIGLYRTHIRSKKWYHKIFYHLLDLTVVNAWLLYRRCGMARSDSGKLTGLHDFKACVAEGLCGEGKETPMSGKNGRKRGRPCSVSPLSQGCRPTEAKRFRSSAGRQPCDDVRFDAVGHWPKWSTARQRCKRTMCKGISRVVCSKCNVHLCFTQKKNCFHDYHID